jgi:hypothetical protein
MSMRVVNLVSPFALASAVACGQSAPSGATSDTASARFVGEIPGTDVRMAAVASQHHMRLYFCGGDTSFADSSKWLIAPLDAGGAVTLGPPDSPWRIDAAVHDGAIQGWVDRGDGVPVSFAAAKIAPNTLAGLYEAAAPCGKVGVIVTQASTEVGAVAQGACIPGDLTAPVVQVNPLMPLSLRGDGSIAVTPAGATETSLVVPAAPPLD